MFKVNNSNNWDSTRLQATDVRASTRFHITASNEWTSSLLKATNINVSTRFEINSNNYWDTNGIIAESVTDLSDERLKCNFKTIENGLEKILKLVGETYNWNNNPDGKRSAGVRAQSLQKVLPEAVRVSPDGTLSVSATGEFALTVSAFNEMKSIIDEQNKRIAKLESLVEKLVNEK